MGDKNDSVDIKDFSLMEGDEIFVCSDGLYKDCPVDYIIESIQKNILILIRIILILTIIIHLYI